MQVYLGTKFASKRAALEHLLALGMTMVHLDARHEQAHVPKHLKDQAHLRLNLSYRFGIEDFQVSDQEIYVSLSFQGEAFPCVLPFVAIFAMTNHSNGDMWVWPDAVPEELAAPPPQAACTSSKPRLKVIKSDDAEHSTGSPKKCGHLKIVK